ncbi:MAG TPA: excinuclease ABC subunit UvrA, partial [Polyangiaceae bacterium]|nr:excinuclease ABC subunit UvrA [Polyangiaceae bacterium]
MARATKANGRSRPAPLAGDVIEITGAREHNLSIERLVLPKQKLVVFTGPSGSGKSSLAFDTLYAEGQRRYVESLSTYARQFLGRLDRPAVERLRGLSPTIAIEQKSASSNPRSTVGTITEIHDYLRVLWARAGRQHCVECGKPVQGRSTDEIIAEVLALPKGAKLLLLAPLVAHRKGEFRELFSELGERGFARVRVNGKVTRLDELTPLDKKKKHSIELVVDRIAVDADSRSRMAEAVELGLKEGKGELVVDVEGRAPLAFSTLRACCGVTYAELSPQSFSFNSPLGMCSACNGLGTRIEIDPELVVPNRSLSIRGGAIAPWGTAVERGDGWTYRMVEAVAKATGVDLDMPFGKIPKKLRDQVLFGIEGKKIQMTWGEAGSENHGSWGVRFRGVIPTLMRRFHETNSERMRDQYRKFMRELACQTCGGKRLRRESLFVRVGGKGVADVMSQSISDAAAWFQTLELAGAHAAIAEGPLREVRSRLQFLLNVGLDYLTLERSGPTLSGGEAQRIRLASQLGSELSGVIYVLDEPSIGLHARDNQRLIAMLQHLRDLGNSVLVVEHDEDTIRAADHLVDFGPGAGAQGGRVVFAGPPSELRTADGLTADYLKGKRRIEVPSERRKAKAALVVKGAREHNLKNLTVTFPLGVLVAVAGPSGAGKSSLVNGILLPALARHLHDASAPVGAHDEIRGIEAIDKVISIDQQPIGRTPRSNPGTYTKAFDEIRSLFAELPDARRRGWDAGRFSFNMAGGRCEACEGDGVVRVEMHFLSDVYVTCEVCGGRRYDTETLSVRYRGKSIADVLETDIDGCLRLFEAHPTLARILRTLSEVGLGYVKLGQSAPTLSGGEAQRIKLARELSRRQTGRTLYVLDEPTTGLHFEDVKRLLEVLHRLIDAGNSVIVIEHHLDVIKSADHVIDLGPQGGVAGGRVMATGTPEELAQNPKSITGPYLKEALERHRA